VAHRVICISSHQGAAAQEVALAVSKALNYRLIDEEIVTRAALEAGVDHEVMAEVERRKSTLVRLVESLSAAGMGSGYVMAPPHGPGSDQPASDELRGLIRSVIEDTADSGDAVIVAHAASHALAGREDVLRVLLTASEATRQERIAGALGISDGEAARAVRRSDADRADYLKRFYRISAEAPTHYDLVINTDKLSPEQAAQLVVHASAGVGAS
jgi:cytidylate kinase